MQTEKNKPYNGDLKTKGTVKSRHRVGIVCFKKQLSYSRINLNIKLIFSSCAHALTSEITLGFASAARSQ